MAALNKVEIGFEGGQVVPLRLDDDALEGLRSAISERASIHELEYEEGSLIVDVGKVIFLRVTNNAAKVGF
jgi:hypothetical protein